MPHTKNENGLPLEIERKYLIAMPDEALLRAQEGCRVLQITQDYLVKDGPFRARVRKTVSDGGTVYTHTAKKHISMQTRVELEKEISEEEYRAYLEHRDPSRHTIVKTRYAFPYEGHTAEVDIYPFWTDRAILETELEDEGDIARLPPFIRYLREVTEDPAYTNAALAADPELFLPQKKEEAAEGRSENP